MDGNKYNVTVLKDEQLGFYRENELKRNQNQTQTNYDKSTTTTGI